MIRNILILIAYTILLPAVVSADTLQLGKEHKAYVDDSFKGFRRLNIVDSGSHNLSFDFTHQAHVIQISENALLVVDRFDVRRDHLFVIVAEGDGVAVAQIDNLLAPNSSENLNDLDVIHYSPERNGDNLKLNIQYKFEKGGQKHTSKEYYVSWLLDEIKTKNMARKIRYQTSVIVSDFESLDQK